jgi:hypothetical protein
MHSRSAPPLRGAGGIARSLHSRATSADWPRMSQHLGWQSRHRGLSWGCCGTTGSSLLLPGWVPLVGQLPKHLCERQGLPMPSLLLLRSQVSIFMSSWFRASAALRLVTCCNCQILQADQPGALFQALPPSLCPCLLAWAVPICLDQAVVAFLVANSRIWWFVVMPVTFQSLMLFNCEAGHAITGHCAIQGNCQGQ